jgi:hypothetical protein
MRYMHWAHDDLLNCPDDLVAAVIRMIEKDSPNGNNSW